MASACRVARRRVLPASVSPVVRLTVLLSHSWCERRGCRRFLILCVSFLDSLHQPVVFHDPSLFYVHCFVLFSLALFFSVPLLNIEGPVKNFPMPASAAALRPRRPRMLIDTCLLRRRGQPPGAVAGKERARRPAAPHARRGSLCRTSQRTFPLIADWPTFDGGDGARPASPLCDGRYRDPNHPVAAAPLLSGVRTRRVGSRSGTGWELAS